MKRRPLGRIAQEIRAAQARDHRGIQGAVLGRKISLQSEVSINKQLSRHTDDHVHYRSTGQIALVYLFRKELAAHRGKTFFNQAQVAQAIQKAPASAAENVKVNRGALDLGSPPFKVSPHGLHNYWLTAGALRAYELSGSSESLVDMKTEELSIANSLFLVDKDMKGSPIIWLGAISAPNIHAARGALEPLEDIISPQFMAEPVTLIPRADAV